MNGDDEIVFSLYANGLTRGEISAHFAQIYGGSVSKETISPITDKVIDEINEGFARSLGEVYAAIFSDAIVVKIRDGQVANGPVHAASNPNAARAALEELTKKWGKKYGAIVCVVGTRVGRVHSVPRLRRRDPQGDLLRERDRIPQREVSSRGSRPRSLPDRAGRAGSPR